MSATYFADTTQPLVAFAGYEYENDDIYILYFLFLLTTEGPNRRPLVLSIVRLNIITKIILRI